MNANNPYTRMQQAEYDARANQWDGKDIYTNEHVVGNWVDQNKFNDYQIYLWTNIHDLNTKDVLDFGCGPGRNLTFYHDRFKSIGGVDISEINLKNARIWIAHNGLDVNKFNLYKNDGVNLDGITDASYDVIMSTICWQHISVYEIRYNLLKEMYRVLRPSGYITIQALLEADKPNTVSYYENYYDAPGTNGLADCVIENPDYVKKDLEELGFTNFHYYIRPCWTPIDKKWIFFNAQK